jgi:hypothetical protein
MGGIGTGASCTTAIIIAMAFIIIIKFIIATSFAIIITKFEFIA